MKTARVGLIPYLSSTGQAQLEVMLDSMRPCGKPATGFILVFVLVVNFLLIWSLNHASYL